MSKYPDWDIGIDRQAVALEKFQESERKCEETNIRLRSMRGEGITTLTADSLLEAARYKIAAALGPFSWDDASLLFRFGPGASATTPKLIGDAYYKYGDESPSATQGCAVLAGCAIAQLPRWYTCLAGIDPGAPFAMPGGHIIARDHISIVEGNRVVTVPKNAKTDRTIAAEPLLNSYVQQGIGRLIRRKLKRVGVDLDDQTRNQRLAKEGSLLGSLCTIDLSAASDSVSIELVRRLLPPDWEEALEQCRSPKGILPSGEIVTYQKWSSMGNAYTFELESLIFWALCSAVMDHYHGKERRLAVYGDDIIVPTAVFGWVEELLSFCGFSVNGKKTFFSGPFRESCGKHYFLGDDVTPFYVRKDIDRPTRLIWAANSVRRWSRRVGWGLDGRFLPVYQFLVSILPPEMRHVSCPDGVGDMSLFGDLDEACPQRAPQGGPFYFTGFREAVKKKIVDRYEPAILRALGPMPSQGWVKDGFADVGGSHFSGCLPDRTPGKGRLVRVNAPVWQWDSFGPWW